MRQVLTTHAQAVADSFDLAHLSPEFYADPYPTYHALRTHAPVKRLENGSWFLTRYEDILPVYRDHKIFSSDKKKEFGPKFGLSPLLEHHTTSLIFNDPPLHTGIRRSIVGALTQRHIAAMEPGLIKLVDELLEAMARENEVDLIEKFAAAIPIGIIGNLLGVPEQERGPLRDWSLCILGALEPPTSGVATVTTRPQFSSVISTPAAPATTGSPEGRSTVRTVPLVSVDNENVVRSMLESTGTVNSCCAPSSFPVAHKSVTRFSPVDSRMK